MNKYSKYSNEYFDSAVPFNTLSNYGAREVITRLLMPNIILMMTDFKACTRKLSVLGQMLSINMLIPHSRNKLA